MDNTSRRELARILKNLALAFAHPLSEQECYRALRRAALAVAALFAEEK